MYVSNLLPIAPTAEQDVIRTVRHGLADVLEWLGEEVGPKPGEHIHVIKAGSQLLVSQAFADGLRSRVGASESLGIPVRLTAAR